MAIVKMKHLRLVAMRADREQLLRQLQRLGCVEVSEPQADLTQEEWHSFSHPDGAQLSAARERRTAVEHAVSTLKHYVPEKGGLLRARPVVSEAEFFDEAAYSAALETAKAINDRERTVQTFLAERGKLETQLTALAPWLPLDVPLDASSTRELEILLGTIPASASLDALEGAILAESPLAQITSVSRDRELQYLLVLCHHSALEAVSAVLKEYGWTKAQFREWTGTAQENDRAIRARIDEIGRQCAQAQTGIAAMASKRGDLLRCLDRCSVEIDREEAKARLLEGGSVFFLEGWVSQRKLDALERLLQNYTCAWEAVDPTPEEYPSVPVQLQNNPLTRPLSMVTEMYSLPAYNGVDPNPLMAPFFILFYGIMMADMGYGLVMMLASVIVLKKVRPKKGMYNFFALLGLCGVSTFIIGALTGGFFGDFIPQLLKLINPESTFVWFWPPLFTPLDDTLMILVGAMILGAVQIITGMVVSFVKKLRRGEVMDAVWEEVTWWVVFAGAALAILGITNLVLILGGVMVVAGPVLTGKGAGKITGIFGSLYNHVTGYFGDILSYARLMALMLAGSVIAQVFNTLGAIPGNVVVFVIISLAGNTLNFALNLLGCYVHDLRLQCLEYFNKFYEDGGKPFRPVEFNTKYVDIQE